MSFETTQPEFRRWLRQLWFPWWLHRREDRLRVDSRFGELLVMQIGDYADGDWFLIAKCEACGRQARLDPVEVLEFCLNVVRTGPQSPARRKAGERLPAPRTFYSDLFLRAALQKIAQIRQIDWPAEHSAPEHERPNSPWQKSRGTKEKARRACAVAAKKKRGVRRMAIRVISSLRRKKANDKSRRPGNKKNVCRPKGYAPLPLYEEKRRGKRGASLLERPRVTQSAPGRVTPPT